MTEKPDEESPEIVPVDDPDPAKTVVVCHGNIELPPIGAGNA